TVRAETARTSMIALQASTPTPTPLPTPITLYLPLVTKLFPLSTVYGVEMEAITAGGGMEEVAASKMTWVRRNGVNWSELQPDKAVAPDWSKLSALDQELIDANQRGLKVILVVRGTPVWARVHPGSECGPIKPSEYASFAAFMGQLVDRYKDAPYGVKYWQIWNEPDAPVNDSSNPYGCWGDPNDAANYGGDDYGAMLQVVYPAVKSVDPDAQVVIGGLLLDCEPQAGCGQGTAPPEMANFLIGILASGAGGSFDGVAFHAYDHYLGGLGQYFNPNWNSSWSDQGPVLAAKVAFVREVLANNGITGKFLMNTETALICGAPTDPPGQGACDPDPLSDFERTKADYVAQTYAAAIAEGLKANIWYSVFGWRNSALLDGDLTTRPAYDALAFARLTLPNPSFLGELSNADAGGASVLGYKFTQDGREIWVLWSASSSVQAITLPSTPSEVRDSQGQLDVDLDDALLSPGKTLYLIWD
ncbi:MAG: cellulase family glycosylhydrolase, partial [Anaerolineales bacterium]